MLKIQRLSNEDMLYYKEKKIVLYGEFNIVRQIYKILKRFNVEIVGVCLENNKRYHYARLLGMPVIEMTKLERQNNEKSGLIIQYCFQEQDKNESCKINTLSEKINIEKSEIDSMQLLNSFLAAVVLDSLNNDFKYMINMIWWKIKCKRKWDIEIFMRKIRCREMPVIILLPMKTADHSLTRTFATINKANSFSKTDILRLIKENIFINNSENQIEFINIWHNSKLFNKQSNKKGNPIKVITAIREPISQNLSFFFQTLLFDERKLLDWILGELENEGFSGRKEKLKQMEKLFIQNGDDIEKLFEAAIGRFVYNDIKKINSIHARSLQMFLSEFSENVVDILSYPFDIQKGFTIVREKNIEVFVYQLEKLNEIVPNLSAWLGVPFYKLVNENIASDKWVGACYKQALNEISISQEYFDRCFSEAYVQHCYSQEDIEKFKARWRPHIKKES